MLICLTSYSRPAVRRGKLGARMGKANTPALEHLPGVSLPLRQAGAALARAEARLQPPRPSQRVSSEDGGGRGNALLGQVGAAHRSGVRAAVKEESLVEDAARPAEELESTVSRSLSRETVPAKAKRARASSSSSAMASVPGALARPGAGSGELPLFDVFDAKILEADEFDELDELDDFEEAEDTVADVLPDGLPAAKDRAEAPAARLDGVDSSAEGTPAKPPVALTAKAAAVPQAALERPQAQGQSFSVGAAVPRVSLVTDTGTLEPAVTLSPAAVPMVSSPLLEVKETQDGLPTPPTPNWLARIGRDVRASKKEVVVGLTIGLVLAAGLFVLGRPYLAQRGLISMEAPTALESTSAEGKSSRLVSDVIAQEASHKAGAKAVPPAQVERAPSTAESEPSSEKKVASSAPAVEDATKLRPPSKAPGKKALATKRRRRSSKVRGAKAKKRATRTRPSRRKSKGKQRKAPSRRKASSKPRSGPTPAQSAGLSEKMPF